MINLVIMKHWGRNIVVSDLREKSDLDEDVSEFTAESLVIPECKDYVRLATTRVQYYGSKSS